MGKAVKMIAVGVVVIVAGAAAVLGPNFYQALQKAKQKRSVADMRNTGTAMFSWLTDQVGTGPNAPGHTPQLADLSPETLQRLMRDTLAQALIGQVETGSSSFNKTVDLQNHVRITVEDLRKLLVPQYLQEVPEKDGWDRPYEYYLKASDPLAREVMAIRSAGRDGSFEGSQYSVSAFAFEEYDADILWTDGFFARWPEKK